MGIFSTLFSNNQNQNLHAIIEDGAFLVDVRTPEEFKQESVKGSVNIPLDTIENNLAKFENKRHIVVFCRSGNRSAQAKAVLEHYGFERVVNGGPWHEVAKLM